MIQRLECKKGWVEIETINNSVKITTDIENDGELSLTLDYNTKIKTISSFDNLTKQKPDELKSAIYNMLGI